MSLLTLPAFLTRRREVTPMPEVTMPDDATAAPTEDGTLMRFLTVGGAVVAVFRTRFVTRWRGGPPFAADKPYWISGFQWECSGCGAYGREGETYEDPNFRQESEARSDANDHAAQCRAMPKPEA